MAFSLVLSGAAARFGIAAVLGRQGSAPLSRDSAVARVLGGVGGEREFAEQAAVHQRVGGRRRDGQAGPLGVGEAGGSAAVGVGEHGRLGPVLRAETRLSTSLEPVRRLLARQAPGVPRLGWNTVDVRDLAVAHRPGNRYLCAGPQLWMGDMAAALADKYRVPRRPVPFWLLWLISRFDPTVREVLPEVGRSVEVSADKARRELGWTMRPAQETLLDTAASLVAHGIVAA